MTDFTELRRDHLARHLRKHLAGEVRFDLASRRLYSTDASIYQIEPLGVVVPKSAEDIVVAVQVAAEMHVPITPRGGGTSLSGQSIGPGVVLDCSKYLNNVLDIDAAGRTARVQPGVVLDQLNRALAPHNLLFGPEVSTSSRANLGGMMGNNSAGSRSIVYGKTIDHVRRLDVVLGDGSRASFGPVTADEWDRRAEAPTLEGRAYRQVREIVRRNRDEILRRFPRILRRVSGYNLDVLAERWGGETPPLQKPVGLHQLLVGSEGTLALTTEAEVGLLPRPKTRGLLVPQFASLAASMDAVAACLEMKPSAVELMDHYLLELTAGNLALRETMKAIVGRPQAVLMVEFSGDDPNEVADRVERLRKRLQGVAGLTAAVPALDPAERDPLWDLRKAGMPLLYGMRGDRKPVTFVEDCAVSPERMPEFIHRFRETLRRHGTDGAFYGHASVGCLHIRPLLNLKDPNDVDRMRRISADVTDLVLEYGGSLSGEHGDGLARSEWNAKMFGPVVYQAFREVKAAFDPEGLLNPGKIVDAPRMTDNLRYGPGYRPIELPTVFDYDKQEGFVRSVEMCNGNGACRKTQGGTMCPSFRATLDERDSTRGRANALRLAMSGEQPLHELKSKWVQEVFDLCLMCKACKAECPSNVDVAKLKAEWLELLYQDRPRPLGHRLAAHLPAVNRLGAPFALMVNWLQGRRPVALAAGKGGGHRPPPEPTAAAPEPLPSLVRPSPARPRGRTDRARAAAGRLLHYVQRAGRRPVGGARPGARGLRRRAGEPALLRPADAQQGVPAGDAVAGARAGAGPGAPGRGRHADRRPGAELPADAVRRMDGAAAGGGDAAHRGVGPPRRRMAGETGPRRRLSTAVAAAGGNVRAARPLPSEGAGRRRRVGGGAAAGARAGRDGAGRGLLRHGRFFRI